VETQGLRHENLPVFCHGHALALHDSVAQHYSFSGPDVSRAWTRWLIGLFASPIGVVVLAALDSTPFFSFPFGIDAVIIVLAARMRELSWVVPLLATTGSLAGAALTFWMGVKIGEEGVVYGSRIVARLDSDLFHNLALVCIAIAAVLTVVSVFRLVESTRPAKAPTTGR
jgi:membrane protein YqaA with SNARE-associated domain